METSFQGQLREMGACSDAVVWVGDRTPREAWRDCHDGSWMLWLCGKMLGTPGWPTRQELVLAACDCAELAKPYWGDAASVAEKALSTARAWARGEATLTEVRKAARAAFATYAAYAASAATYAAYAAFAAARAAYAAARAASAADPTYAASPAYAAYAAYAAAADDASATDARKRTLAGAADIVRKRLMPGRICCERARERLGEGDA